jgi:hypothetical protein
MGDSWILYGMLMGLLCQTLGDARPHLGQVKTLAWCLVGLLLTGKVHIPGWASHIVSPGQQQASRERRLYRWLANIRVHAGRLYAPLIREALRRWGGAKLYLALDTTTLWGRFTVVYLSVIYRGRAIPLLWQVLESASASVAFAVYEPLLQQAARLLPVGANVVFLGDRGFANLRLLRAVQGLGWHFRVRLKGRTWVYRHGQGTYLRRLCPALGQAHFYHKVLITKHQFGPVYLAVACPRTSPTDPWYVVSDEPTDLTTFDEYGLRFDREELFLDEKSANFQLETSELDDAAALSRLAWVLAIAILIRTAWGVEAVALQLRRTVDGHWLRGLSYLRIGWHFLRQCLAQRLKLPTWLDLNSEPDPEPAVASIRKAFELGLSFKVRFFI